jgi:hypothetical protein
VALQKTITLESGFQPDYHRVQRFEIKKNETTLEIMAFIDLYKDAAARAADNQPIKTTRYDISVLESDSLLATFTNYDSMIAEIYELLKLHADFSGATDV